ncbi:channel protein TolC [Verminephrobacter aporrectodeae subsp. tuberculatae]|uniref:Channel protein TolC n=1 Tax=Verminephrobacter aporrectodeae subsp. tuberculatae TaxID=1110392 RepID=A0ABT3KYI8_9BURK|nr:TolC family outer membrane protein [Verminephrobacter aporrectodeae]MCW5223580.1 channel protein TolC [Verminephrobacter aporrectodeae subsp. tuberculatae]MCW5289045.1 channel protein TolC [Verminephrobacter aporrectodeae subsp. tuberculatae]MCW5323382.1 channel protein TolC [Verminephrobacter aporrectodeae subsp. tuberculatae]MCW8164409.1 channel protein TolC [Verminephrobacter aporrectodeae subsp. tuberculatae]MCW8171043.1 channel protein TolC [Verminephrobacter aporrectodeae subsp. tuber
MALLTTPLKKKPSWLACTAALGLLAGPSAAMDLMQAYQIALQQDATVRAVRAAAQASDELVEQAKAQRLPDISFNATRNRNDLANKAKPHDYYSSHNASLSLRQPIFHMATVVGVEQAHRTRADVEAQLQRELQNLGVRVSDAYLQLLFSQDQLALMQLQKDATTTGLDAAHKLLKAGKGTRTDIDEAQTKLDIAISQELEVRQQLDYARRQLEILVNQPVETLSPLDADRLSAWSPELRSVQDWLTQAEDSSPDIQQLKARVDVARLEIERAASGHLPTLDAVAQWTRNYRDGDASARNSNYTQGSIGLRLNLPLYAGGEVNSAVRKAVAEELRAKEMLEAGRRELSLRIHTEFRGVSEGRVRIQAQEQVARSAAQMVISIRQSFKGGVRTLLDLLNAEQEKERALRDLARMRYTYLMSCVRLQSLVGSNGEASIAAINALLTTP